MAWQDILVALRDELVEVRAQRKQRAASEADELREARGALTSLADTLGIAEMLSSMNITLLEGQGSIESIRSWESEADDEEFLAPGEGEDEEEDIVSSVLTWEENGERDIAVEVVLTAEGIALLVNGVGIRPERDALEEALVEAFRDELEL